MSKLNISEPMIPAGTRIRVNGCLHAFQFSAHLVLVPEQTAEEEHLGEAPLLEEPKVLSFAGENCGIDNEDGQQQKEVGQACSEDWIDATDATRTNLLGSMTCENQTTPIRVRTCEPESHQPAEAETGIKRGASRAIYLADTVGVSALTHLIGRVLVRIEEVSVLSTSVEINGGEDGSRRTEKIFHFDDGSSFSVTI